jgi:hypothetical protein
MQKKLLGIISADLDVIDEILIKMFCNHEILEKKWEYNGTVQQLYIDFEKAHDCQEGSIVQYST